MANMKFSYDELRVIKAALFMTGGNEIDVFVTDKKLSEEQCNSLYDSVMSKIDQRLSPPPKNPSQ